MQSLEINDFISLKLENKATYIYVKGRRFKPCMRLVLQIPKGDISNYDIIDSIDEAADVFKTLYQNQIMEGNDPHSITPEEEFWGHCSNIQAWVESNYDTRLLHSNIAFSLLKELVRAGDPLAKRVYKDEIAMRLSSGYLPVISNIILDGCLDSFNSEELEFLKEELKKGFYETERNENYPQSSTLLRDIGYSFNKIGLYDEAIIILKRALQINPLNPDAANSLGIAYKRKGDYENAKKYYKRTLEINPNYGYALGNLSEIYNIEKKYRKSIEFATKALNKRSDNYEAFFYLGHGLYKLGNYNAAITNYELALKVNPEEKKNFGLKDDRVLVKLAKLHLKKGFQEKAKKYCDRALLINPEYVSALRLKDQLDAVVS